MTWRICSASSRTGGSAGRELALDAQRALLQHAAVEPQRVVDEPVEIGRQHARAAQPRELRELVDEPLERLDLRR